MNLNFAKREFILFLVLFFISSTPTVFLIHCWHKQTNSSPFFSRGIKLPPDLNKKVASYQFHYCYSKVWEANTNVYSHEWYSQNYLRGIPFFSMATGGGIITFEPKTTVERLIEKGFLIHDEFDKNKSESATRLFHITNNSENFKKNWVSNGWSGSTAMYVFRDKSNEHFYLISVNEDCSADYWLCENILLNSRFEPIDRIFYSRGENRLFFFWFFYPLILVNFVLLLFTIKHALDYRRKWKILNAQT